MERRAQFNSMSLAALNWFMKDLGGGFRSWRYRCLENRQRTRSTMIKVTRRLQFGAIAKGYTSWRLHYLCTVTSGGRALGALQRMRHLAVGRAFRKWHAGLLEARARGGGAARRVLDRMWHGSQKCCQSMFRRSLCVQSCYSNCVLMNIKKRQCK